jgi:hypothetical protein
MQDQLFPHVGRAGCIRKQEEGEREERREKEQHRKYGEMEVGGDPYMACRKDTLVYVIMHSSNSTSWSAARPTWLPIVSTAFHKLSQSSSAKTLALRVRAQPLVHESGCGLPRCLPAPALQRRRGATSPVLHRSRCCVACNLAGSGHPSTPQHDVSGPLKQQLFSL